MKPINYDETVLKPDGTHARLCDAFGGSTGGGGGFDLVPLWNNPNSNNTMSQTDVDLGAVDGYRFIIIRYASFKTSTPDSVGYMSNLIDVNSISNEGTSIATLLHASGSDVYTRQVIGGGENKLRFAGAYKGSTASNDWLIPVTVYGIK